MKKTTLLASLLCISLIVFSQNVGINTSAPSERLDVNGNINIQGNLKVNGVAGQPGQSLVTNESGVTVWADLSEYKNFASFTQNGNWNVPAGVTKIVIELWGAGGGGASGGGGGSGLYLRTIAISVTAGGSVTINIGSGGTGATTENGNANNAGPTSATIMPAGSPVFTATGGSGGTSSAPGTGSSIALTGGTIFSIPGNHGEPSIDTYHQYDAGIFATIRKYGDGGKPVMNNLPGGSGGYKAFNTTTLTQLKYIESTNGRGFGAGGGGGFASAGGAFGSSGSAGTVIIHY